MSVSLELRLDERHPDRVLVTVLLTPDVNDARLDGAALELLSHNRERLGPRMLLPIAGTLSGPICTRIELRATGGIPPGASIHGTAWWGDDQATFSLPADPYTELEAHVRGRGGLRPCRTAMKFTQLGREEIRKLQAAFSWLSGATPKVKAPEPEVELTEEITEELGLNDEDAAFLRELLNEP